MRKDTPEAIHDKQIELAGDGHIRCHANAKVKAAMENYETLASRTTADIDAPAISDSHTTTLRKRNSP